VKTPSFLGSYHTSLSFNGMPPTKISVLRLKSPEVYQVKQHQRAPSSSRIARRASMSTARISPHMAICTKS